MFFKIVGMHLVNVLILISMSLLQASAAIIFFFFSAIGVCHNSVLDGV